MTKGSHHIIHLSFGFSALLFVSFLICSHFTYGQIGRLSVRGAETGLLAGPAFALTDIGGALRDSALFFVKNQLKSGNFHLGLFHRQRINNNFGLMGSCSYIRISDADSLAPASSTRPARNLSFSNRVFELALVAELHIPIFRSIAATSISLHGGVVVFNHKPSLLQNGAPYDPLFYFNRWQAGIPAGAGLHYQPSEGLSLGLIISWRKLFFDFLDNYTSSSSRYQDGYMISSFTIAYFVPDRSKKGAILCSPFH